MNYSEHARDQMAARGIDEDDVERTVNDAFYVGLGDFGRKVYVRRYGQRGMRFVVHCSPDGGTVITVRKQSRPYMGV
jgi:hypothetical protein